MSHIRFFLCIASNTAAIIRKYLIYTQLFVSISFRYS